MFIHHLRLLYTWGMDERCPACGAVDSLAAAIRESKVLSTMVNSGRSPEQSEQTLIFNLRNGP